MFMFIKAISDPVFDMINAVDHDLAMFKIS